jgi:hypothetical protein
MSLDFHPIGLDEQSAYMDRFSACAAKTSDYSFVNLWGWADEYGLAWAWTDDLVWIRQSKPEAHYWAPIGPWERVDWSNCFERFFNGETAFVRVPELLLQIWEKHLGRGIKGEESRDHWDYLYDVQDLITLRGKKFHKKKNLLNQFIKKYAYEYLAFDATMTHMALGMQEDWCTWRDCESSEALAAENRVIYRVLNGWGDLAGIEGGALLVNRQMVAYTIAEKLSEDTFLIHFEKGDQEYKGVYQAMNQMFLENAAQDSKYVNREQDLGNEGLRKAKLSYHPVGFLKKGSVTLPL